MKGQISYFVTTANKQEYLGLRLFAFSWDSDKVIQVCITHGDPKRGKTNNVGIYLINKLTFLSNYMAMSYVEPTTKKEFESSFKKAVKMLELGANIQSQNKNK